MARTKGATSDKFWSEAVRLAVYRETQGDKGKRRKRLNVIADKLCAMAIEGDMAAIKEIGDRLEGRPKQAVDMDHSGSVTIEKVAVEFVSSDPEAKDA